MHLGINYLSLEYFTGYYSVFLLLMLITSEDIGLDMIFIIKLHAVFFLKTYSFLLRK